MIQFPDVYDPRLKLGVKFNSLSSWHCRLCLSERMPTSSKSLWHHFTTISLLYTFTSTITQQLLLGWLVKIKISRLNQNHLHSFKKSSYQRNEIDSDAWPGKGMTDSVPSSLNFIGFHLASDWLSSITSNFLTYFQVFEGLHECHLVKY